MSHPSVSVVIPAYRAAKTIARAVDSVVAQTCPPKEVVIVDDGSPDENGLLAALEPYGGRTTLIRKENGGAASARNLGIEQSRGELIAFLDADDYWEPDKLERQLDVFRNHPELGLIATRFFLQVPGQPRFVPSQPPGGAKFGSFPENQVVKTSGAGVLTLALRVWTSTVVVRRETLGRHRFDSSLQTAEDRDLWIRLIAASPVYMVAEPLATGVLEPGSLSRSNVDGDYANMIHVLRRHCGLLTSRELRYWERAVFKGWAGGQLAAGQPRAAMRPAWERFRRDYLSAEGWWILVKSAVLACTRSRGENNHPRSRPVSKLESGTSSN
jgi:glycosyltransferase involved in cell wall biosynthesis